MVIFYCGKNVGNPAPNIMKPVYAKEFDVRYRSCVKNVCNTAFCVLNVNTYNHSPLASHNCNFKVVFQYLIIDNIGCTPLSAGGGRYEPPTRFSERGGLTGSKFLEVGCWERGGDFFRWVAVFT